MNEFGFAKIWFSVALCAIVALALVAIGPAGLPDQGIVDPFHGASQMPGDPTNTWPSHTIAVVKN
jgi:hypothetical protein